MQKNRSLKSLDFQLVQTNNSNTTPATLQSVEYKCQIINNILKTSLLQTFTSLSNNEYSETFYYFPIEDNICLESFEAKYQGKTIRGIVKEKEQAKKEYKDNKNQGNFVSYASVQKTANQDYVQIKLGNLPPNEQVEVILNFSQELGSILNKYYIVNIPLQYVKNESQAELEKNILTLDLFCTGRISYAESKSPATQKTQIDENTVRFSLSQENLKQNQNLQIIYSFEGMFEPQVIFGSSKCYHEDNVKSAILPVCHSAMVTFIPNFNEDITKEIDDAINAALANGDNIVSDEFQQKVNIELVDHLNASRSEFLFLLDRSGSMNGLAIQRACQAITLFLKSLPNDSYFNVISFGSEMQKLFPQSLQYTTENLNKAVDIICKYQADLGGTEIYEPLADIFRTKKIKGYNKQIFLLTDGQVQSPQEVVGLVKKNNKFNRVHSIGFGSGADQYLIKESAIAGKGISKIVDFNCDLSEVTIQMLQSCITPSFDDFSINYDKDIFDSTYPLTTSFPCVFKDEIINIHFFFKPEIDISSLTSEQKHIEIEYFDSYKQQSIKKVVNLDMQDCFTCNSKLQESVFKLGKQLYLNENIDPKNDKIELIQQAVDFQLLTEKTALVCVIQKLNDEQKVMFENSNKNQVYQQSQNELMINVKEEYDEEQEEEFDEESVSGVSQAIKKIKPTSKQSNSSEISDESLDEEYDDAGNGVIGGFICVPAPECSIQATYEKSNYYKMSDKSSNEGCENNISEEEEDDKSENENSSEQCENALKDISSLDSIDDDEEEEEEIVEEDDDYKEFCLKFMSRPRGRPYKFKQQETDQEQIKENQSLNHQQEQEKQLQQYQQQNSQQQEIQFLVEQKQLTSQQQSKKYPQVEFNNLLKFVDSQGVWKFDQNLIGQLSNIDKSFISEIASSFSENDAFMTLFILVILELYFPQEKMKWVLISKKSLSYIKKHTNSGVDVKALKERLLTQLSK